MRWISFADLICERFEMRIRSTEMILQALISDDPTGADPGWSYRRLTSKPDRIWGVSAWGTSARGVSARESCDALKRNIYHFG